MNRYIFSFLFFFCAHAVAQPVYLLHKPYAIKYGFLDSLRGQLSNNPTPGDAQRLDDWARWAKTKGDLELAGELKLLNLQQAYSRNMNDEEGKEILNIALDAHENKLRMLEVDALKIYGEYLCAQKKNGQAFEYDMRAHKILSTLSAEEFPPKQNYLYVFSMHYAQYGDRESSIRLLNEACSIKSIDNSLCTSINNALGVYYRSEHKYDSAIWYFNKVSDTAIKYNKTAWVGIAAGNIGICYFYQKRYKDAIPLLQKDIEISMAYHQIRNGIHSMDVLAEIYLIQNDIEKAEQLLRRAVVTAESMKWWPDYKIAQEVFSLLAKAYARKNDMRQAYLYSDSARIAGDSAIAQFNALSIAKAQEKEQITEHKFEVEQLNHQKQLHALIRDGLLSAIFLLVVIAFLFINRQNLKQKKLRAELTLAAMQLDSFRQSIKDKNDIIEQFTEEIERIKSSAGQETDVDVLTQLQHAVILTDEQWENFRLLFEKVHKNFFVNLKKKMPELSQSEIRLLALTKLRLSSKEMAAMMGISPSTIRIYRHRLRRKLNLDKENMIEELVENI